MLKAVCLFTIVCISQCAHQLVLGSDDVEIIVTKRERFIDSSSRITKIFSIDGKRVLLVEMDNSTGLRIVKEKPLIQAGRERVNQTFYQYAVMELLKDGVPGKGNRPSEDSLYTIEVKTNKGHGCINYTLSIPQNHLRSLFYLDGIFHDLQDAAIDSIGLYDKEYEFEYN